MADVQTIDPEALRGRIRDVFGEAGGPVLDALARTDALGDAAAWTRALALCDQLLELRLDPTTVTAAVLVAGVADREPPPALRDAFGAEVGALLEAVGRLEHIRWEDLEREATENLRKMFLALASDVRGVLIALADRVHTMRTLDGRRDIERRRLARETMEVYAPLANRLGVWQLKWELEDLAFRELEPQTYREIGKLLAEKRAARREAIDEVERVLELEVSAAGIEAKITGRPKHIFSIYKKMQRKGLGFDRIYDVLAVRVLVKEVAQCYAVLGIVHGKWAPIAGEFDDYIARPKANDYRSLHTAVVGPGGRNVEVQIRTFEMHELSEYGIAAHWRYKEGGGKAGRAFEEKINWLRQLMEWQKEVTDLHDLAESLKTDIFKDQVYVFTPNDEVVDLPQGATPIDFAYRIHTMVGHRCRGAKVDGQIVPLDYELQTGQRVEIITAKDARPSRDWLNPHLGYVKSAGARQKIRQWYRAQQRDASVAAGRELVEREIKRLGVEARGIEEVARLCGHDDVEDFLAKLGFGDLSPQHVATRLVEFEAQKKAAAEPPKLARPASARRTSTRVSIGGIDDVMSSPAKCCHPVPGDAVVGYVTRGRGLMIHRADCPNLQGMNEPERLMDVDWSPAYDQLVPVEIAVVAQDRAGLLRDIADVVAAEGINMSAATADRRKGDGIATLRATLEIRQAEQLVRVLARIERLPYVQSARRIGR